MCGLKPITTTSNALLIHVTPHVGVWIETSGSIRLSTGRDVTPHVGVWIETQQEKHWTLWY